MTKPISMRTTKPHSLLAGALLLAFSGSALASGGEGFTENRFASEYQVAPAQLSAFAAGNTGVLPGSYWRIYQYLAFQAARGKPLTPAQMESLHLDRWHIGGGPGDAADSSNASANANASDAQSDGDDWPKARAEFAKLWGLPPGTPVEMSAQSESGEDYLNCHPDAFTQAVTTLKARARLGAGGKPDAWHKLWLQGQDAVFANCAEPPRQYGKPIVKRTLQLPPPLPANAPDWLKYDQAYQAAAANFYARNFDAAHTQFQTIAANGKSPWQKLGGYLAARSLIRKALLNYPLQNGQPPARERNETLLQAKKELEAILPSFPVAKQMLSLVDARINPAERVAVLARTLEKAPFNEETAGLLSDYLVLLDNQPRTAMIEAKEPLTAWIGSMQAESSSTYWDAPSEEEIQKQHKIAIDTLRQRWLKQADPLWIAPLLSLARANELNPAERKAAAAVPATHPLYQTVQYHLARLAILEGHPVQADKDLDRVLAAYGKNMSVATKNRYLALKMLSAGSQDEFLKAAVRQPDALDLGTPIDSNAAKQPETDDDFERTVFRFLPLPELKTLAQNPLLPAAWKPKLQETMLARALVLGDEQTALDLLDSVAKPRATTRQLYTRYRAAKPGQERKLAGSLILVNTPELSPSVFDQQNQAKYWGCKTFDHTPSPADRQATSASPRYLSQAQAEAAAREQKIFLSLPLRTEYIAPPLLEWAKQKPKDEEAPKALHFLVASTRMECPYGASKPEKDQLRGVYSREAFDLLHKLYPNSVWAKDTKYYF